MTDDRRDSLKSFDAYADRNGQDMSDDPRDQGIPARTQHDLKSDPMGEAETARLASGMKNEDATDATAAETPAENLRRISDPSTSSGKREAVDEAVERATSSVGSPD